MYKNIIILGYLLMVYLSKDITAKNIKNIETNDIDKEYDLKTIEPDTGIIDEEQLLEFNSNLSCSKAGEYCLTTSQCCKPFLCLSFAAKCVYPNYFRIFKIYTVIGMN